MIELKTFWLILVCLYLFTAGVLVLTKHPQKKINILNVVVVIIIAISSFFLDIHYGNYDDIIRISDEIYTAKYHGYDWLALHYIGSPLTAPFYYLGVVLGDTRYVSCIATFCTYSLQFFSLYSFVKRKKIGAIPFVAASCLLFNATYITSCAFNIRFTLALAIIFFAIELNDTGKTKFALVLMLVSCTLHKGALPIVVIYLLVRYLNDYGYKIALLISLLWGCFVSAFSFVMMKTGVPFLVSFGQSANRYFIVGDDFDKHQTTNQWIIKIVFVCFLFFISYLLRQKKENVTVLHGKMLVAFTLFSAGCLPMGYTALARYSLFGVCYSVFSVGHLLNGYINGTHKTMMKNKEFYLYIIIIICFIVFMIYCNYSSVYPKYYLNFEYPQFFSYQF